MYQITKKMLAYYQHITKHNAFQVVSQAEAAYLTNSESESAKLFITILKKEFIHRYTFMFTHIFRNSLHLTHLHLLLHQAQVFSVAIILNIRVILTLLTNSSNSSVSATPLPSPSNTDDVNLQLESSNNEPTTITHSSYLSVATTPVQPTTTTNIRNYLENFSP